MQPRQLELPPLRSPCRGIRFALAALGYDPEAPSETFDHDTEPSRAVPLLRTTGALEQVRLLGGDDQPDPLDDPPTYLRGWNHVELGPDGSPYAIVPLRSLLKLDPDSEAGWRADVPVHHDLDIDPDGAVHILGEVPRRITRRGTRHVILDNTVTAPGTAGETRATHTLFGILAADPQLGL